MSATERATAFPNRPQGRLRRLLLPDRLRPDARSRTPLRWAGTIVASGLFFACLRIPGLLPHSGPARLVAGGVLALGLIAAVCACDWAGIRRSLTSPGGRSWAHAAAALVPLLLLGDLSARLAAASGAPATSPPDGAGQWAQAVFSLFLAGVLLPCAEELAMRFTLFLWLRSRASFLPAAFVSSAVFGLLHWTPEAGPLRAGAVFLAGLVLCWSYEGSGSLRAPVLAHCVANMVLYNPSMFAA